MNLIDTEAKLVEIEQRAAQASTAPWIADTQDHLGENWMIGTLGNSQLDGKDYIVTTDHVRCSEFDGDSKTDAEFIAHSREDVPDLCATIRQLWERVAKAEAANRGLAVQLEHARLSPETRPAVAEEETEAPVTVELKRCLDASINGVKPTMENAAEMLWIVVANVSGGDWAKQSEEWQAAAIRWRNFYYDALRRKVAEEETR